eukprot:GHVR01133338.1.p1 GENE.GHVR01133338.1~~GHVR01133338.1.p1  ORF type:complete len:148 (+),score=79.04 GHVR01133338.1:2-445(+)
MYTHTHTYVCVCVYIYIYIYIVGSNIDGSSITEFSTLFGTFLERLSNLNDGLEMNFIFGHVPPLLLNEPNDISDRLDSELLLEGRALLSRLSECVSAAPQNIRTYAHTHPHTHTHIREYICEDNVMRDIPMGATHTHTHTHTHRIHT